MRQITRFERHDTARAPVWSSPRTTILVRPTLRPAVPLRASLTKHREVNLLATVDAAMFRANPALGETCTRHLENRVILALDTFRRNKTYVLYDSPYKTYLIGRSTVSSALSIRASLSLVPLAC
ncbi:unnamed protein product, partial [Brenthis ino]